MLRFSGGLNGSCGFSSALKSHHYCGDWSLKFAENIAILLAKISLKLKLSGISLYAF